MTRILTKLRIDEVSAVVKGANPHSKVMILKADDDTPGFQLFDDIMKRRDTAQSMYDRKRRATERLQQELSEKEKETQMSRSEEMAEMHKFAKTHGGMNSIAKHIVSKGDTSLTEHEYTELWKSDAGSNAAFVKEFEGPRNEKHDALRRCSQRRNSEGCRIS